VEDTASTYYKGRVAGDITFISDSNRASCESPVRILFPVIRS
jgi:hypothetical protein